MTKLIKWVLSALYGLIMIEVLIMISPFAFYWYTFYGPTLRGLHTWRPTAWMESFFLPHSVITTSPVLEFIRWKIGPYAFSLGLIVFLICAIQVYGAKLLHRGVVHSALYRWIRHPQYLCLGIAGFGLLTIWPRIIIMVLYVGMLIAYYLLALFEERYEAALHPDYAAYRERTAMFIPGNPGGRLFHLFFSWIPSPGLARAVAIVVVGLIAIGGGTLLRGYTISHAAALMMPEDRLLAVAIWPTSADKIKQVVDTALGDSRVRAALDKESDVAFTAHLLPVNYGMINMFADVGTDHRMFTHVSLHRFDIYVGFFFPFLVPSMKDRIMGTPQDSYKVVFSRVDMPGHPLTDVSRIRDLAAKMTPVAIAEVAPDPSTHGFTVKDVITPPRHSLWGSIVMPMF